MAGGQQGPVPGNVMNQMLGNMHMQEGLARIFTAGQDPSIVTAAMQSARERGAMAAENIRQRYYKAEFQQINEARLKPLNEELERARLRYEQNVSTTVMSVGQVLDAQQTREMMDATEPPPPPQYQAIPGKAKADGTQTQEVVELPGQPAPNPALQSPQLNAMTSKEVLALIDPVSGQPVPLASPRGTGLMNKYTSEVWGEYGRIAMEQMQVLSEYAGNPYADRMMDQLMKNVTDQSNLAMTGMTDPRKAQEWWEGRQKFETEQETAGIQQQAARQQLATTGLGLEKAQQDVEVGAREGALLANTEYADLLGPDILNKVRNNLPLTRAEKLQASAASDRALELREKQLAIRAKERAGTFQIPTINVTNPQNWQADMTAGNPTHQSNFKKHYADLANRQAGMLAAMPKEARDSLVLANGGDQAVIEAMDAKQWTDPNVLLVVERIANSSGAMQLANDYAYLETLPLQESQQPELTAEIDSALDELIADLWSAYNAGELDSQGNPLEPPDEEKIRAERYVPFFGKTMGRMAPSMGQMPDGSPIPFYDRATENRVYNLLNARDRLRQQSAPAAPEWAPPLLAPNQTLTLPPATPTTRVGRGRSAGAATREGAKEVGRAALDIGETVIQAPGAVKDYGVGFTEGLMGIEVPSVPVPPRRRLQDKALRSNIPRG